MANTIAHITRNMTLLPGDIISMGTALGLKEDDPGAPEIPSITKVNLVGFDGSVSVAIEGLGKLANPILTITGP